MAKSNKAKRLAIFHFCAPLASKILGSKEQLYLCPICGKNYPKEAAENGDLTLEDVPPRSMGGTGLLLTCKTCNSQAGYKIDNHIKNRLDLQDFYQIISGSNAVEGKQIPSDLLINNESFQTQISQKDGFTNIEIIEKANNPVKVKMLKEYFESGFANNSLDSSEFKLTKKVKFDPRLRKVALLKSGFLLVTAMLGYTYAFDKRLSIVRKQISNPEKNLLGSSFWIEQIKDKPLPRRRIISVSSPLPLFLVTFDDGAVILPNPNSPANLYETMKKEWKEGIVNITGNVYEWTKEALMVLDIHRYQ